MATLNPISDVPAFCFDDFRLDRRDGLSRRPDSEQEQPVTLGSRALDVLMALVEGHGTLVTKQALMDAAWPGMAVEDSNLAVQISSLRRVLDEAEATFGASPALVLQRRTCAERLGDGPAAAAAARELALLWPRTRWDRYAWARSLLEFARRQVRTWTAWIGRQPRWLTVAVTAAGLIVVAVVVWYVLLA